MMSFDNFIYNESSIPEDENEKKEFFKDLEQKFCDEVTNSEVAKQFFEQYNPDSISTFVKMYASKKADLTQHYSYYAKFYNKKETHELHYQHKAEEMLHVILQKKLFNMQLLWRAERLEIKEINISYDFQFWEKHIASCPFIPAIEEKEVKAMKEFLLRDSENNVVDHFSWVQWQDYSSLMEKDKGGLMQEMPEWYEFYDERMGTGTLLVLPDIKGAKEEYYFQLNRREHSKSKPDADTVKPKVESRPYLHGFGQDVYKFSKVFETDKHFVELFKYHRFHDKMSDRQPDIWELRDALDTLSYADRPIYFPGHLVWDKAIITALKIYTNTKIAESLDFVYDNYLTLKELGISRGETKEEIKRAYEKDQIVKIYRDAILHARKLNGESEDFDY